jgi:hypothetical protein
MQDVRFERSRVQRIQLSLPRAPMPMELFWKLGIQNVRGAFCHEMAKFNRETDFWCFFWGVTYFSGRFFFWGGDAKNVKIWFFGSTLET